MAQKVVFVTLPAPLQVFELFLKHLVGGLHTVYTKLKRLEITPIVCNVEQVRILRGLGAIQPGVNRCKLLADVDFDALYKDCTTTRLRLLFFVLSTRPVYCTIFIQTHTPTILLKLPFFIVYLSYHGSVSFEAREVQCQKITT